ncbi:MAG: TIGR03435 family protein [Acidobacteriota bacterium]
MNRTNRIVLIALSAAVAIFAQNTPRAEFEVASIRPSQSTPPQGVTAGVRMDGPLLRCAFLTLKDYIGIAYRVKLYQISGPDWVGTERFDITATMPSGGTASQLPEMLRSLLEERFQLKVHRAKNDFPVYALEVAKGGLKMQATADDPAFKPDTETPINVTGSGSGQGISISLGNGSSYTFANNQFLAKRLTMPVLSGSLERFLDRPIVDMTELTGSYDFSVNVTPEDYRAMLIRSGVNAGVALPPEVLKFLDTPSLGSLFDGLQKLGLRLDSRKLPLDTLIIDDTRKTPTEN